MMPFLALALAAQEPQLDCANAMTQADMNACAARDFEQADAELNRIWPGLIAGARAADREIDRTYDHRPGYEQMLREAQRAWLAFRDAQCTYEAADEARGGSMEPMVFSGCAAQLTRARIRQLTGADQPQPEQ
jgi:uncharacterized protein YecT (DUF1311 family)